MSLTKFNPRTTVLLLIILVTAGLRLMINCSLQFNPLATFTPIAAMALFGGAYFTGDVKSFAFPLLTLFISDVILSYTVLAPYRSGLLYSGWYWVYGAFALMSITGKYMLKDINLKNGIAALLTVTLIHWIVSDFGVWLQGTLYPITGTGYVECLVAAIPYELRFVAGTAVYGLVMFGSFEWMQLRYPQLKRIKN
jgi:hypothetical protein